MSWVSTIGRRFLQAYSEGLMMSCPMHRVPDELPAAIDQRQDNVRAALRPDFAATDVITQALVEQSRQSVRH